MGPTQKKIKDQGSMLLCLQESKVESKSRKTNRKYEVYILFKATSLDEIYEEVYVDREIGGLNTECRAFQHEQKLRENGEQRK